MAKRTPTPPPVNLQPILAALARGLIETTDRRTHVRWALEGLTTSLSATCSALTRLSFDARGPQIIDVLEAGTWSTTARDAYMEYLRDPSASDPFYAAAVQTWEFTKTDGLTLSARRRDLLPDRTWYSSVHYKKYRSRAGHDDCIYAVIRAAPDRPWTTGLSLHRATGLAPFTPADLDLAHAWLAGLAPLITLLDPNRAGASTVLSSLTPRQRGVLLSYAHGQSAKQVARALGLSITSVHTYAKQAFRKLGVSGRAEAVALCISRGWLLDSAPATNNGSEGPRPRSPASSASRARLSNPG
ncbi:MAG: LuxR C-terminal-related transcriptional regulator [Planctomycetota bacterium]|nr:LuxR C-terminal-related transcriptional regulator [Planctomycetota bacterium]